MLPMVSIYLLKMPRISNNRNVMLIVYLRINWTFPIRQRIDYHVHGRSRWVERRVGCKLFWANICLYWTSEQHIPIKFGEKKVEKYLIESLISANFAEQNKNERKEATNDKNNCWLLSPWPSCQLSHWRCFGQQFISSARRVVTPDWQ